MAKGLTPAPPQRDHLRMADDREIWARALEIVTQHGDEAATHAARRAASLAIDGQDEDCATWIRIGARIAELESGQQARAH